MPSIRQNILDKLGDLTNLPTMSGTVQQVQELLADGSNTAGSSITIGKVIEKDMGLSAKILKIANSVFYSGRYGQIGDVKTAVTRLGTEEIIRICTAVGSMQLFKGTTGQVDLKEFWTHSIAVALAMRGLASKGSAVLAPLKNAYTAGLFHDIGILVLDRFFMAAYGSVFEPGDNSPQTLYEREQKILGTDHGEVGGLLLKRWKLPQEICEAVTWHHAPDGCPEKFKSLCELVNVGNFMCAALGLAEPGDRSLPAASNDGAWHDLALDASDLNMVAREVEEGIDRSGVFVSLSL
ncbi:MAG: HDOD domain-containing protein [Chitinivibrionales bacterium]|nr:HDOD domain-containing protein [Chitinivibrionales bacterium]